MCSNEPEKVKQEEDRKLVNMDVNTAGFQRFYEDGNTLDMFVRARYPDILSHILASPQLYKCTVCQTPVHKNTVQKL